MNLKLRPITDDEALNIPPADTIVHTLDENNITRNMIQRIDNVAYMIDDAELKSVFLEGGVEHDR